MIWSAMWKSSYWTSQKSYYGCEYNALNAFIKACFGQGILFWLPKLRLPQSKVTLRKHLRTNSLFTIVTSCKLLVCKFLSLGEDFAENENCKVGFKIIESSHVCFHAHAYIPMSHRSSSQLVTQTHSSGSVQKPFPAWAITKRTEVSLPAFGTQRLTSNKQTNVFVYNTFSTCSAWSLQNAWFLLWLLCSLHFW